MGGGVNGGREGHVLDSSGARSGSPVASVPPSAAFEETSPPVVEVRSCWAKPWVVEVTVVTVFDVEGISETVAAVVPWPSGVAGSSLGRNN